MTATEASAFVVSMRFPGIHADLPGIYMGDKFIETIKEATKSTSPQFCGSLLRVRCSPPMFLTANKSASIQILEIEAASNFGDPNGSHMPPNLDFSFLAALWMASPLC